MHADNCTTRSQLDNHATDSRHSSSHPRCVADRSLRLAAARFVSVAAKHIEIAERRSGVIARLILVLISGRGFG